MDLLFYIYSDSFDVVRDWKDILSGGEKQRMAVARLFYHKYVLITLIGYIKFGQTSPTLYSNYIHKRNNRKINDINKHVCLSFQLPICLSVATQTCLSY